MGVIHTGIMHNLRACIMIAYIRTIHASSIGILRTLGAWAYGPQPPLPLSLSLSLSPSLSLSLSHTHTHTQNLSLSLSFTLSLVPGSLYLYLYLSLSISLTPHAHTGGADACGCGPQLALPLLMPRIQKQRRGRSGRLRHGFIAAGGSTAGTVYSGYRLQLIPSTAGTVHSGYPFIPSPPLCSSYFILALLLLAIRLLAKMVPRLYWLPSKGRGLSPPAGAQRVPVAGAGPGLAPLVWS
jgi:hypothetical protein